MPSTLTLRIYKPSFRFCSNTKIDWKSQVHNQLTKSPKLIKGENHAGFFERFKYILAAQKPLIENVNTFALRTYLQRFFCTTAKQGLEIPFEKVYDVHSSFFNLDDCRYENNNSGLAHAAVLANNPEILRVIAPTINLSHRAQGSSHVERQNLTPVGESALDLAAMLGYTDCVRILLENDVPADHMDLGCGKDPLHYAAEYGHLDCVQLLLEYGAKLEQPHTLYFEPFGLTAYQLARRGNHSEVAEYLADVMHEQGLEVVELPSSESLSR